MRPPSCGGDPRTSFNPIGSDPDLESGIYAQEPSHVIGQLVMAAQGQKDSFTITGIEHRRVTARASATTSHVWDLARAHVAAVERFDDVLGKVERTEHRHQHRHGRGRHRARAHRGLRAGLRRQGADHDRTTPARRRGRRLRQRRQGARRARLEPPTTLDEGIASALAWGRKRKEILGYA